MLKRILTNAAGVLLGLSLGLLGLYLAESLGYWPLTLADRNTAYFRDVLSLVRNNYVDPKEADYDKLTHAALDGMLKSLDPHSEFLPANRYDELQQEMSSQFGGIGVQVEMRDHRVIVIAPLADTPGERAGIRRGDQVLGVDGQLFDKPSLDTVVEKLRGKPGTIVVVNLRRPAESRNFDVKITREVIKILSVRDAHLLEPGVGYVRISAFTERTGEEFARALDQLLAQGMKSLVLDLRNNPGGVLDAAVAVAEPFFKPGELIVYTQGRTADTREEYRAGKGARGLALPVAVLINSGTASASEIVAGALKDTHRAVLVGETSFGKGLVQSVLKLRNGEGLRLTTAKYYTPRGISIQAKGIEPQIPVAVTPKEEENLRIQRLRTDIVDANEFKERFGSEPVVDRELQTGMEVLKGVIAFDATVATVK